MPALSAQLVAGSPPPTPSKAKLNSAAAELAEAEKLDGDDRYSSIAHLKARRWRFRGAEDPRLVRSHLFRRPAQGRNAGRTRPQVSFESAANASVLIGGRDHAVTMMATADGTIREVRGSMPMATYHPTQPVADEGQGSTHIGH